MVREPLDCGQPDTCSLDPHLRVHEFLYFKSQAQSRVKILSNALDARVAALLAGPLIPYFEEAGSGLSRIVVLAWHFVA